MNVEPQECYILHIAPRSLWEQGRNSEAYQGDTLDSEGFLHCSKVNQVIAVANALFRGHSDLVLLLIHTSRVVAPIKYEGAASEVYPHIYGPINRDAVIAVYDFLSDAHGEFQLPEEVITKAEGVAMRETTRINNLLVRLAGIPARVVSAVASWSESQLRTPPVAGGWSVAEIFAHMRASDDIMAPRVSMILVRDQPPLAAFDERRWAEVAGYAQADFQPSLQAFTLRRAELVSTLRRIAPEEWRRVGVHEARGRVSLLDVITTLVEHEEEHCAQLEAAQAG